MPWDQRMRRRLKLRDLDTFLAVARWGSMAKAASHLSVSQPAVSNAIADMEHTLGVRLLDRSAQGVEPTIYGHALLKWANAIFDDMRQGVSEIEYLADPTRGELRVEANEPIIAGFLSAVLDRLARDHPGITFDVTQALGVTRGYRELRERTVDLLLGRVLTSPTIDDIQTEVLFDDPIAVVAGANNPLARRRKVKFADLVEEQWVLPRAETIVGSHMLAIFRAHGIERPRKIVVSNSIPMRNAMLATGRFVTVMPRSVLQFGRHNAPHKVLPIVLPEQPAAPVGLITLKNRMISPVAQLFIDSARELAKDIKR
jgi:DNA-binding transcriptional LysR family regulator